MAEFLAIDVNEEFIRVTNDFCKKSLSRFISEKYPDGNFELLAKLIAEAREIGLISVANSAYPGFDYGVWGSLTLKIPESIFNSLNILLNLAKTCATFA